MTIIPVILSGGAGSRLWPLSRTAYPKQLLPLRGRETLLQETARRAIEVTGSRGLILVCGQEHRFQVAEQMHGIGIENAAILLEPLGRNTAPAIALAAHEALSRDRDAVILVLPSDHTIRKISALTEAVRNALPAAGQGALITFGVRPHSPMTGYGYIKAKQSGLSPIAAFVEKPDLETAKKYLASGNYYWNSGMFLFRAGTYLSELKRHAPDIERCSAEAWRGVRKDLDFKRIPQDIFAGCPSNSIDYAVMEKTDKAMVIPLDAGWSDLGSWGSLWDVADKDARNNVALGDVVLKEVGNSYVRAEHRLVSVIGIEDCVVVETADAVLVASRKGAEQVGAMATELLQGKRSEANLHRKVYRPWGSYETLDAGAGFKVQRLNIKPHASLSMQLHNHRAEHWVVLRGRAKVTCDGREYYLTANQSTFIAKGLIHRLENAGSEEIELVEVQTGDYLGDDDIVRFEDKYGRE
ncbi:MAG TPA: mannose-1-phosphate guanylyltransferase/mannose-6-phosphate isomerase [Gammaproteobacteria bacterium]|nr:mannose-1-phosphate guanylyltransferase/mannose-6-phosphate isomerase [Gammaproteobacteria bacterium]